MNILERFTIFDFLFEELTDTNSRNDKELIINTFKKDYPELQDDLNYIFETLAGKHPIGWTFRECIKAGEDHMLSYKTIRECIKACEDLMPKTVYNTVKMEEKFGILGYIFAPIVNRTLKLGIGNSQLAKNALTPMLAKKYEGDMLGTTVYVTEKLDGNRCIAHYDGEKWNFTSRSGKPMNVNFDMAGLPTDFIYDGEVMSQKQTALSILRNSCIAKNDTCFYIDTDNAQSLFNTASGLINRQGFKSGLIYNIFDIIDEKLDYEHRRDILNYLKPESNDIRILPVLYVGDDEDEISCLLDKIVSMSGEGVMINFYHRKYEHKRTDALLKYKQVQTIDMRVVGIEQGKGKYTGLIGAINCCIETSDGLTIVCDVGSGLSDIQRREWAINRFAIVGRIVEIAYHELSQDRDSVGTKVYSLRFPRLVRIREDKDSTSEY